MAPGRVSHEVFGVYKLRLNQKWMDQSAWMYLNRVKRFCKSSFLFTVRCVHGMHMISYTIYILSILTKHHTNHHGPHEMLNLASELSGFVKNPPLGCDRVNQRDI